MNEKVNFKLFGDIKRVAEVRANCHASKDQSVELLGKLRAMKSLFDSLGSLSPEEQKEFDNMIIEMVRIKNFVDAKLEKAWDENYRLEHEYCDLVRGE